MNDNMERELYSKIIRIKDVRGKWIKYDKLSKVISTRVNWTRLKSSPFFSYCKDRDAIKVKYPYQDVIDKESLLNYLDTHRTGIPLDEQLQLAYEGITEDINNLEDTL